MPSLTDSSLAPRKAIKPPSGYEDHLSRRAAAALLGFESVFKVRQLEKEGRLHPVHGAMGSAWYSPAEVAAVRGASRPGWTAALQDARPDLPSAPAGAAPRWSDAALIAYLRTSSEGPNETSRPRTIVDLVADTGIPISRAERVYRFWLAHDVHPTAEAARVARTAPPPSGPASRPARGSSNRQPAPSAPAERRSGERLERDALLRQMRDPDPRVRSAAFDRLKKKRP